MVDFYEHSTKDLIPDKLWVESGYDFGEHIWEPTIESFKKNRPYHQEIVANMLKYKIGDALASESGVPEFTMTRVNDVNIRGYQEKQLVQRIGMYTETDWDGTTLNFSYDLARENELPDFASDNQVGLYNDVISGKLHTAKLQLILPFKGNPIVHYQGYPVLNRPRGEITQRILSVNTITDLDYPFGDIENVETQILLAQMSAYIAHHTE